MEENDVHIYKGSLQDYQWKKSTHGSVDAVHLHQVFDKKITTIKKSILSHWNKFQTN